MEINVTAFKEVTEAKDVSVKLTDCGFRCDDLTYATPAAMSTASRHTCSFCGETQSVDSIYGYELVDEISRHNGHIANGYLVKCDECVDNQVEYEFELGDGYTASHVCIGGEHV